MGLVERDDEMAELITRADAARDGRGCMVIVTGEAGAGKTALLEEFARRRADDMRVLWGACDPLATPRPLGPLHDVAPDLDVATRDALGNAAHAYEMFDAVSADFASRPTLFVIDDVQWADQGTSDLLRHLLRRIRRSTTMVVVAARADEESADGVRVLLGDIARTAGSTSIAVQPLSVGAVGQIVGDQDFDPAVLHQLTGGNAFFVTEMLEHRGEQLPTTVRDAILARTVGLDPASWEVMNLIASAPGPVAEPVVAELRVSSEALRRLSDAHLLRRTGRGVGFRHDLCRLAVAAVIPPGAAPDLHRRMIAAYDAAGNADPALLTHHAIGAGDHRRQRSCAVAAAQAAARSGAHQQSAQFYRTALAAPGGADDEAQLLESLAAECYLVDRLDEAIDACGRALAIREARGDIDGARSAHHALAVYEWYNANRSAADQHVAQAISEGAPDSEGERDSVSTPLGHSYAMSAFLSMQSGRLDDARSQLDRAADIAAAARDGELAVRVDIIRGVCDVLAGAPAAREGVLDVLSRRPAHLDEIYSSGYSNLTYLDVEQRRLADAADLLSVSIDMTVERDLPVCRVWQLGSRGRLALLQGQWSQARADADEVLGGPSAPLARIWPLLVRGMAAVRSDGQGAEDLTEAWYLAQRYGEPMRLLPAASALVERMWLTGVPDDRIGQFGELLTDSGVAGLEWARGELAMWLRRAGVDAEVTVVAPAYRSWLSGDVAEAAEEFARLGDSFAAALAWTESGVEARVAQGLASLDRLGAFATADRMRRSLREAGAVGVPSRRRRAALSNPSGLTNRQLEVLVLMADGLTNAELAERLFLSAKTVDHHVSAVLAKLGAANRRDAVRLGRELGIC